MRVLYFQPFSGASGDMILGALIGAGLGADALVEGLSALRLHGWRLDFREEMRGPFLANRVRVLQEPAAHHHHRHLRDLLGIVEGADLPVPVKERAGAIFRRLAEAEARVHGIPVESVHFHEVGAVDSIVDVVGICLGIHILQVDEIVSAPVTVGTGFVRAAHGTLPLPAPATLELLRGFPIEQVDSGAELTTPTGAAVLTTLAATFGTMPPLVVSAIGYGAGDERPGPVPNVLRAILGEREGAPAPCDRVVVLETNIDDMSPQWLGHLMDRLLDAGALDVTLGPVVMKKSRPAHAVTVIAPAERESEILRVLFRESTTLGVRRRFADRVILHRERVEVSTSWGTIAVKVGRLGGEVVTASPEYEELKALAEKAGLPLKEAHAVVMGLYRNDTR